MITHSEDLLVALDIVQERSTGAEIWEWAWGTLDLFGILKVPTLRSDLMWADISLSRSKSTSLYRSRSQAGGGLRRGSSRANSRTYGLPGSTSSCFVGNQCESHSSTEGSRR